MLNVFLDGQLYDDPIGLDELSERIFYNEELAMYLNQLDGDVVFIGDGYNYLREQFKTNTCSKVGVEIRDDEHNSVYTGVIFINDISWNLPKRTAECKIVSDKFVELIDNNKGIKVQLGVNLGKNQETIIVDSAVTISVPNPLSTVFVNRIGWRVFDVFQALVRFMSNEELTFVSDYFDPSNGELASYDVIMYGEELRLGAGNLSPLISYQDFFSDMNKLHNLAGRVEGNTLRIEPKSYFRTNLISANVNDINDVTQELNTDSFYASIKMGSAKVSDDYGYLIRLSFNGFQKEQFFFQGQCNIYNELDLELRTLITDTNIIQDMLPVSSGGTNNSDYDDDIILIHCSQANFPYLTQTPLFSRFYFNEYYTNMFVSQRWEETYPFSILQLLESNNQLVFAGLSSNQTSSTSPTSRFFSPDNDSVLPFFDTGGDFQIGNIQITPTSTETVAYFEAPSDMIVQIAVDFIITGSYWLTDIRHVDTSGNIQSVPVVIDTNPLTNVVQQYYFVNGRNITGSAQFYMPANTRVFIQLNTLADTTIFSGGQLEIFQLGSYGGVYQVVDNESSFTSNTNFSRDIDSETWAMIKNDPFKRVSCTYLDGGFTGYPIDIKRNIKTGEADIKLYQRKSEVDG